MTTSTSQANRALDTVRELEPLIRAEAVKTESERRLSPQVATAFRDAGLYAMYRPAVWGGAELDPMTVHAAIEAIARIDGATAWNLGNAISADCLCGPLYPEDGAQEIFGTSEEIHALAAFPPGRALPVDGGFRVMAETPFLSGCHESSWCTVGVHVIEEGQPRKSNGEPILHIATFARADVEILDSWHTLGMRGTGSHTVRVKDAFVPRRRVTPLTPIATKPAPYRGPLYRLSLWAAVPVIGSVAVGIAASALEDVCEIVRSKTPAYMSTALRDRGYVHTQLARARAKVGAARAYLRESLENAWRTATEGQDPSEEEKIDVQLAAAHANQTSAEAVDLVYDIAGATGIRDEYSLQKRFRDAHTLTQHAFGNTARFESSGRLMMGLPSDWGFFAF